MKSDHGKKARSTGVGESKTFIAPGGESRDAFAHLRGLHVGGKPVEEVVAPSLAHLLTRDHTDEGIAERNQGKVDATAQVRRVAGDRAHVTAEGRDQILMETRDFKQGRNPHQVPGAPLQPWEAPNAMKELAEKHIAPGMRPRFLSPIQIKKLGQRGFEIVKDTEGNPVRLGELVLAQMPEEKAAARNRAYREIDHRRLRDVDSRNEKHVRVDSAGALLRPIVNDAAELQGDDSLHSHWAETK